MKYIATLNGRTYAVEVLDERRVTIDGQVYEVDLTSLEGQPLYSLLVNGKSFEAFVYPDEAGWQVLLRGRLYQVQVVDEREHRLRAQAGGTVAESGPFSLKAPMPGVIVAVPVQEGQEVKKGDVLVVLESMKMQNELKSPRDGVVTRVRVQPGQSVEQNAVLVTVE